MSGNQGLAGIWHRLFKRRGAPSPAEVWLDRRQTASPEEVVGAHFAAIGAHDLDWILATMTPERAKLYQDVRVADKRRLTVSQARVLGTEVATGAIAVPMLAQRYRTILVLRVEYELILVEQDKRRDGALREGKQWSYYILVTEGRGKPWLIADWGT